VSRTARSCRDATSNRVRAALSHPCFTGTSRQHLGDLVAELADLWTTQHEAALQLRRGHGRRRAAGAGPKPRLALRDRVLVTLVVLRFQLPHQALAVLVGVDRATVTRAVHEVRPLLARRGLAVPGQPGVRLRTLADLFAYADACGVELRLDASETQVRRPRAHRPGRRTFMSGRRKQNTIKATTCSDGQGRTLWSGAVRPGRVHDQAAVKTEGIADLLGQHPTVKVRVDEGYRGLATAFPEQVAAPPRKPPKDAPAEVVETWKQARTRRSCAAARSWRRSWSA
jgi:Helix-turn-helix of DDE superfamily endonuclease/DDE superfamily endonuclease